MRLILEYYVWFQSQLFSKHAGKTVGTSERAPSRFKIWRACPRGGKRTTSGWNLGSKLIMSGPCINPCDIIHLSLQSFLTFYSSPCQLRSGFLFAAVEAMPFSGVAKLIPVPGFLLSSPLFAVLVKINGFFEFRLWWLSKMCWNVTSVQFLKYLNEEKH